jgi:peptide deformylase
MSNKDDIIVFDTATQETVQQKEYPIAVLVPETSPILKEVMPEYDFNNQVYGDIKTAGELASILVESCKKYNGYGLSANQVGIPARVFVMGQGNEYVAFFNPVLLAASTEEVHMVEGCLSFPYLGLRITRPAGIVVQYQDYNGEVHKANFTGISARCFLHELDHMNGIVYTSKCKPLALQQGMKKRDKINGLIHKAEKNLKKLEKHGNSNRVR